MLPVSFPDSPIRVAIGFHRTLVCKEARNMRALDLFSGPGGMTIGMKRAGFEPIVSVEKRKDAVETYSRHTPEAIHFNDDIRKISFGSYKGRAEVIYGGPPCQPFSTGGLRKGTADARNMFPEFIRAIREVRPRAFIAENVPGLATKSKLQYLAELLSMFENEGYKVTWKVLLAADYGVPQKRRRLFIVGMKDKVFCFPKASHGPDLQFEHVPTNDVVSIKQPLGIPPDCPVIFAKFPDPRRNPYAGQVYNGGGRPIDLNAPCHTILASAGGYKTHWVDTLSIAPEYAAHLMSGGAPREGAVPGARRLTIEESALIQSFPSEMTFAGSRSSQYTQIGDAVPPLLAEVLGKALQKQLAGEALSDAEYHEPTPQMPLFDAA